ncbi:NTP transferase domain-containing protein [Hymenobacter sp. BRD67]|uniref:nucleotidyltransferase family protein n=1 Tax=Hymenobacter sp. BRD67 TaxID=2675877 RepID=UPI00156716E7|nr:nucleotidyltransferase family protein [Hymenobacter sp. BRD67]QKG51701.1 nucleotidyltransferase family protein [Hymenobacter sp. BRD67]
MHNDPLATVGLLLLAAGSSSRLARPKQLLPYQGKTLLRHAAEVAVASPCRPLVLVTGALHDGLLPEIAGLPFHVVRNDNWADGMGGSIAAGLAELETAAEGPKADAVVVILCDQPLLTPEVIGELIVQFQATRQPVVASAYAGIQGVPALFGRAIFPQLLALRGASGARELLQQYAHLPSVAFPGGATDVDTEAQYAALAP